MPGAEFLLQVLKMTVEGRLAFWMATLKNNISSHIMSVQEAAELALNMLLWILLAASRAKHWNNASRMTMMQPTSPLL